MIAVDDGSLFVLDADRDANDWVGQRVTVEGIRSGLDRLEVIWIGPA